MKISQTDYIVGALALGFIVYISARGELSDYLSIFTRAQPTETDAKPATLSTWFDQQVKSAQTGLSQFLPDNWGKQATIAANDFVAGQIQAYTVPLTDQFASQITTFTSQFGH